MTRVAWSDPGCTERLSIVAGLERARPYVSGVVLDVGCGRRTYRHLFEGRIGRYIGCDIAAEGPARLAEGALGVVCDAQALPFRPGSLDTVLSTQVLNELDEPALFFAECRRALREGGHLVLTAPFFWRTLDSGGDCYRFTAKGLARLALRHGFEVVALEPRGGYWATAGQMLSLYLYSLVGRGPAGAAAGVVCGMLQSAARALDGLHRDVRQTLGHTLVARKVTR